MSAESDGHPWNREIRRVLPAFILLSGLLIWWAVVRFAVVPRVLVPSPTTVGTQLTTYPELYISHAGYTLQSVLLGGGIGIFGGVVLGILLGSSRVLRQMFVPYLVTARVTPKIAVAPLLLVYLGTGYGTALAFVSLVAFFPATISTLAGFDRVPPAHLDLLWSVDAGWGRTLWHVRLPHAIPDVIAGVKQSVALAFVGAIVAEWIVGTPGLGSLLVVGAESVQPPVMFAALIVLFSLGLGLYAGVAFLLERVVWYDS